MDPAETEHDKHSQPVRVLHVIETLGRGGAERQLVGLLRRMNPVRVANSVCHLYPLNELGPELVTSGVPVCSLQVGSRREGFEAVRRLCRHLRSQPYDVVHTWLYDADVCGRVAARLCGVPVIASYLQNSFWEPEVLQLSGIPGWKSGALRHLDAWTARFSGSRFVACSDFVRRSAARALGLRADRMEVVYNSIDPGEFVPEPSAALDPLREELGVADAHPLLICVSRFNPPKGHRVLLDAVAQIAPRYPRLRLLLAGRGPDEAMLQQRTSELGLEKHVQFLGHRPDVRRLLQLSDAFVFPSLCAEGLPLALIEAMAASLPCVAWQVEPNPEVVEEGASGFLAPLRDVEQFAAGICALADNPARARAMGARGRAIVETKFNIRKAAVQLEDYYVRCTATQRRG